MVYLLLTALNYKFVQVRVQKSCMNSSLSTSISSTSLLLQYYCRIETKYTCIVNTVKVQYIYIRSLYLLVYEVLVRSKLNLSVKHCMGSTSSSVSSVHHKKCSCFEICKCVEKLHTAIASALYEYFILYFWFDLLLVDQMGAQSSNLD